MHTHERNDVKQSIGLEVTLELLCVSALSSVPRPVEAWFILSTHKPSFGDKEKALILV
jgi:hypothetical protein